MTNSTILTADRTTHLKVVVISVVASIVVLVIGIAAHTPAASDATARMQAVGPAVKAGKPMTVTQGSMSAVR